MIFKSFISLLSLKEINQFLITIMAFLSHIITFRSWNIQINIVLFTSRTFPQTLFFFRVKFLMSPMQVLFFHTEIIVFPIHIVAFLLNWSYHFPMKTHYFLIRSLWKATTFLLLSSSKRSFSYIWRWRRRRRHRLWARETIVFQTQKKEESHRKVKRRRKVIGKTIIC